MRFESGNKRALRVRPRTLVFVMVLFFGALLVGGAATMGAAFFGGPQDPGVRSGAPGAGGPVPGLTPAETAAFDDGQVAFAEVDGVAQGLGPRFNMDSCGGCHAHPAGGGSSPFTNPQVAVATAQGAANSIPFFINVNGPVREARFPLNPDGTPDGGVHDLFTITGRSDAPGCVIAQPNFDAAAAKNNLIFRIPTPVFGAGLIEAIQDAAIVANMNANRFSKSKLGITGHPNFTGNDGTITRFGWKAQNKSLEIFASEAYNVEQGVTNEGFPNERDETVTCVFNPTPEDHSHVDAAAPADAVSDIQKFVNFMRFLDQPTPAPPNQSTSHGRLLFNAVGCNFCHTPSLTTAVAQTAALRNKPANLYSDLLVHNMGPGLADNVAQGAASGDEFRTAPLWGVGQRIFFLHDGRTDDLLQAIKAHASKGNFKFPPSEANQVIGQFLSLRDSDQQDILNFLRSL